MVYIELHEYVLKRVEELLDILSEKIGVTVDHGIYVGERASPIPIREYGHLRGHSSAIVEVQTGIAANDLHSQNE